MAMARRTKDGGCTRVHNARAATCIPREALASGANKNKTTAVAARMTSTAPPASKREADKCWTSTWTN